MFPVKKKKKMLLYNLSTVGLCVSETSSRGNGPRKTFAPRGSRKRQRRRPAAVPGLVQQPNVSFHKEVFS